MITEIKTTLDLKKAIARLETAKDNQKEQLAHNLHEKFESLKPRNLIRHSAQGLKSDPLLKKLLLLTAVGIAATVVIKKIRAKNNSTENKSTGLVKVLMSGLGAFGVRKALSLIKNNYLKKNESPPIKYYGNSN